ncbi:MAG: hypothetical protein IT374_28220 [Polyangiaceae bacterium]|nr:hypothetical protein [Polyangiaceae bacterium]
MCEEGWKFSEEPLEFDLGARVRRWSKREGLWKVGTVRGLLWVPGQRSGDPGYREVIFDGTAERVTRRASDLRAVLPGDFRPPLTDDEHLFEPGDRVQVRDARSDGWRPGTVRQVVVTLGEEVRKGEYALSVSYLVDLDAGGSGRFGPADMACVDARGAFAPGDPA